METKIQNMSDFWDRIKSDLVHIRVLGTLGLGIYGGAAITAIFSIYIASLLGVENYGKISYFVAIANIAYAVSFLGVGNIIKVYVPKGVNIFPPISFVTLVLGSISSTVIFIIFHNMEVSLFVIGLGIFDLGSNYLLAKSLHKTYTKYYLLQKILSVVLAIVFYFFLGTYGIILGYALSFSPLIKFTYQGFKESKIEFSVVKARLGFILHNYVFFLARTLSGYTDRLIIAPLLGLTVLGNYELGMQFLSVLYLTPIIIFQYMMPREAVGKSTGRLKLLAILLSVVFAITTVFLAPLILPYLFPKFKEAIGLIQIIALAIIPRTISTNYISKLLANEKTSAVSSGAVIQLFTEIPIIVILGRVYGPNGLAIGFLISEISQVIFLAIVTRKIFQKK